jgi:4-amino-4-deoxy-L-arabinose transferase-like glycosyltransferase
MSVDGIPLRVLTLALALGCMLGLMHVVCVIGFQVPFDPNEGWNAAFAHAVLATGSPYPAAQSLMINNYPPLSFYLVAAISKVTGDAIVAGRIIALAALFAVALGIETTARRMGCSRFEALFAALLFSAGLMLTSDYVGMDDPQLLGHAIAMGGLLLALREPRTPRLMVASALLFVLAFFVKHNLVVLPAALALWLLLADRRHAVTFILGGLVFLLIGLGLFKQVFGVSLLSQIASARTYALENIWRGLAQWLPWGAILATGAVLLFLTSRHDRHAVLCTLYALVAVIAGAYFLGGAGVDANALFDADIALALCAGLLMNRLQFPLWQSAATFLYAIPLASGLWFLDAQWRTSDYWLHPLAEERGTAAGETALIRAANGPALCEMLSLCFWAGKPAEADVFNLEQSYLIGARSDAGLVRAIATKHFALIQLEQLTPFPLTPAVHRALLQNYRIVRTDDDRVFLAPR